MASQRRAAAIRLGRLWLCAVAFLGAATSCPCASAAPRSVQLEELTWTELAAAIRAGATTAIVPVGGTEQSGPYIALGKHNVRAHVLAGRIAERLGNAIVAPVIAYVPEGHIAPPTGHMRLPGTISVSDAAFQGVVEGAVRSLWHAGFTEVVLLGDHGGYAAQLRTIAAGLGAGSAGGRRGNASQRVHCIDGYYTVTQTAYVDALKARRLTAAQIGTHAGAADTALMLAVDASLVRPGYADDALPHALSRDGIDGDPRPATAALGQLGVDAVIARSVADIRRWQAEPR